MAISWDVLIFSGWYLLFLVGSFHTFKIVKNQKIIILGYWEIAFQVKGLELRYSTPNYSKHIAHNYIY